MSRCSAQLCESGAETLTGPHHLSGDPLRETTRLRGILRRQEALVRVSLLGRPIHMPIYSNSTPCTLCFNSNSRLNVANRRAPATYPVPLRVPRHLPPLPRINTGFTILLLLHRSRLRAATTPLPSRTISTFSQIRTMTGKPMTKGCWATKTMMAMILAYLASPT